nr:glycosyltransferase [uncultured Bacteroides sp.]
MKVVHIQNSMSISGNAAYRLSCVMRNEGIDSSVLNISSGPNLENVYINMPSKKCFLASIVNKINRNFKLKGKIEGSYYYSPLPVIGRNIAKNSLIKEADVIYIHWIAGILSTEDIQDLISMKKPVIFFMHDMWDFTGGCHHSFSCNQYKTGCKHCEMFNDNNNPRKQIECLRNLYLNKKDVAFVSPSKWMADCAKSSNAIAGNIVTNISNIVDVDVFKPMNKLQAKQSLGFSLSKKIITFGCQAGTKNKYKGWDYLRSAINSIDREDIQIVVYGSDGNQETREQINSPITFLGYINDESKLATICNATDVFVSPSLAESFGLTFLENILCGTPVVGFDNTAIGEIIIHGVNGYLARNKDSNDLKNGINYILDHTFKIDTHNYNPSSIIQQHIDIIEKIKSI